MTESFQFCGWCGAKVAPYAPLDESTEDVYIFGKQEFECNTYFCPQCEVRRLRPYPNETGEICPGCQQLVSYECSYCPRCGHIQRWARATADPYANVSEGRGGISTKASSMGVTLRIRQVEPETRDLGSFDRAPIRIGKAPECDVRFPGVVGISGVHAVLEWKDGKVWITDPGARNPLEVDGAMIPYAKPAEIRSGSCIRLGSVALIVEYSWDERPRGGRRICMPNSETRLDVAKARLHAYLEDTLDDPGYEPEDLLLHDLWVVENHDLPWLVKQMSRSELPASRRRWVTSLLRSSEHQEEMERAIVASGGGSEPGQT